MFEFCLYLLGLHPMKDSFDLLQPNYIRSLRVNPAFVPGFASHLQRNVLNTMYMGYCFESGNVTCDPDALRTVVCKVQCKQHEFKPESSILDI